MSMAQRVGWLAAGALAWPGCGSEDAATSPGPTTTHAVAGSGGVGGSGAGATGGATAGGGGAGAGAAGGAEPCANWTGPALVAGTCDPGHDAALAAKALRFDRAYTALVAWPYGAGVGYGLSVPLSDAGARERVRHFVEETDSWDYASAEGHDPVDDVASWSSTAGLYTGVGIAADAYRYGVLRDEGAEGVERAREHLLSGLESLHLHVAITGVEGVIARGVQRTDLPGPVPATTPLFDGQGNPLPTDKDNGSWRDDNSGLYPDYVWIDSCSRDMLVGWATAFGAAWEVMRDDPSFSSEVKSRLQQDALELGHALMVVRESGYDLEIPDADGRTTFHGYLNEYAFDREYVPNPIVKDGFHAVMALGIVGAYAFASEDPALQAYLYDELVSARNLPAIAVDYEQGVDAYLLTKFSGFNMVFQAFWLALRYVDDPAARADLEYALHFNYYDRDDQPRQPQEMGQSLFDFVYAAGMAGSSVAHPMSVQPDPGALGRGLDTLQRFPEQPIWDLPRENCSETEIDLYVCQLDDGQWVVLLGEVPPAGDLLAEEPIPIEVRPPSSYVWRSNPYVPNGGGDGSTLAGGIDFRWAYWLGRWAR